MNKTCTQWYIFQFKKQNCPGEKCNRHTIKYIYIPDFQLHPTFSEQPPTNGVKTWLVKMCRGQHTAAYLLLCVKTTFTRTDISKVLDVWKEISQAVFHIK